MKILAISDLKSEAEMSNFIPDLKSEAETSTAIPDLKSEDDTSNSFASSLADCSFAIQVEMQYEPEAADFIDGLTIAKAEQIRASYRQILPRPATGGSPSVLPPSDQSHSYDNSVFNSANIVGYQQFPDGSCYPILKVPSNFVLPAVNGVLMQMTMQ